MHNTGILSFYALLGGAQVLGLKPASGLQPFFHVLLLSPTVQRPAGW